MSNFRVGVVGVVLAISLAGAAPAHAGYTTLHDNGRDGLLLACKVPEGGGYGPVWRVSLLLAATQWNIVTSATVDVIRGGSQLIGRTELRTTYPGQWTFGTTYASRVYGDRLSGVHGWGNGLGNGGGGWFNTSMASVGYC